LTLWSNARDVASIDARRKLGQLLPINAPANIKELKRGFSLYWWRQPELMSFLATVGNGFYFIRGSTRAWLTRMASSGTTVPAFRTLEINVLSASADIRWRDIRPGVEFPAVHGMLA